MTSLKHQTGIVPNGRRFDAVSGSSRTVTHGTRTILAHILRLNINLAVWQRAVPEQIAAWLRRYLPKGGPVLTSDLDLRIPAACVPGELMAALVHRAIPCGSFHLFRN